MIKYKEVSVDEIDTVLAIILNRRKWMNENNIFQWSHYDRFDESYFKELIKDPDQLFLGVYEDDELKAFAAFQKNIEDNESYVNMQHFASSEKGYGSFLLMHAEELFSDPKEGVDYLRLHCVTGNPPLLQYYLTRGYSIKYILTKVNYYVLCKRITS